MADQHDATLMVQLAQWSATMGLEEAMQNLWSDGFDPDTVDARDPLISRVLTFGETLGTLTKNGLMDTALVLDWMWISGIWNRVAPSVAKMREQAGVPELYENFEALAAQQS
jgi:hypothetical protein